MLKILYKTDIYTYSYVSNSDIFSGQVVTFNGNREVRVCDSESIPIGFFTTDLDENYKFFMGTNYRCSVAVGQSELATDIFEPSKYRINDFLYCSDNGKITNEKKYWGNIIFGIVNSVTPVEIGFITMFARGLESSI
jgi:hypothetical protein